ncbi:MAG TPA: VIT domain-containing protein, partial [Vicinamibacterales bacterium]|nr:VIT domain-containing protein [Vicinamibacterales bacterium]
GAVAGYEIRAGDRRIKGRVERRDEARAHYETARVSGRTAALVEEERPNFFTQRLGNIPAATDVIVELTIDHRLAWIAGGAWEWRFPTVVAPRYLGAPDTVSDASAVTVDVAAGATTPTAAVLLTIADDLSAPPESPSHRLAVTDHTVTLAADAALDRDIVIRWSAALNEPGCRLRRSLPAIARDPASAYGLVTIVPPVSVDTHVARDLVLLLDVSGSMQGRPLEQLKAVVTVLIGTLGDEDRLEMVAFASGQKRYQAAPVRTTADERRRACAWIDGLEADGGTELISAIAAALRPLREAAARQVVVVTDGLIGFEAAAVASIRDALPAASRLHAIGVGSAPNRAFLRPAARAGRGVEVLIHLDEPAESSARRIAAATREPVVIDVSVEGTALVARSPRLPDLLTGSPILAPLRLRPDGGMLIVRGRTANGAWQEHVDVPATIPGEGSDAIAALWAREAIDDLELDLACGGNRSDIDRRIEQLALQHSISSRLTSWVAVAEEPSVDPREPVRVERIPQSLPYGMSPEGVGVAARRIVGANARMNLSALSVEEASEQAFVAGGSLHDVESQATMDQRLERSAPAVSRLRLRLRELVRRLQGAFTIEQRHPKAQAIQLRGRLLPTPGQATTTIEFQVTSPLDWQPLNTATIAGRRVPVVVPRTTRTGRVDANSLVRITLAAPADDVLQVGTVEVASEGAVLVIAIAGVD